jgi:GNAT superfamily N-acetyltransferase
MTIHVRRLGPGDEHVLELLARDDDDFDLDDRGAPREPLTADQATAFLDDPAVLAWIAHARDEDRDPLGFMYCHVLRKRAGAPREVLLYEIGVRAAHRRAGVGRALLDALDAWMRQHDVGEAWVLADNPGADAFYRACGFTAAEQPTYLTRVL